MRTMIHLTLWYAPLRLVLCLDRGPSAFIATQDACHHSETDDRPVEGRRCIRNGDCTVAPLDQIRADDTRPCGCRVLASNHRSHCPADRVATDCERVDLSKWGRIFKTRRATWARRRKVLPMTARRASPIPLKSRHRLRSAPSSAKPFGCSVSHGAAVPGARGLVGTGDGED